MYLPYVRGKQYELIALRELVPAISATNTVSPIIEPVKRSTSTLLKTLQALAQGKVNFTLVINPREGELINRPNDILQVIQALNGYANFQIGVIVTTEQRVRAAIQYLNEQNLQGHRYTLIHNVDLTDTSPLEEFANAFNVQYNVINYGKIRGRRYHRNFPAETLITLEDQFNEQQKNADYLNHPEERFSEEHQYYQQDGYIGFSDFATIGGSFSEGGFLPYAVVIHLTFLRDESIFVRHFVSDSNDDNANVPGKFAEALQHLVEWLNGNNHFKSYAVEEFRQLHEQEHYPGLGSIKKLSLKHHIELIIHLMAN